MTPTSRSVYLRFSLYANMTFVFQQPGAASLLDAINLRSNKAEEGGGVFAFATKGGIDAIFDLPNIVSMLSAGRSYHLIVGIDAITNAEALLCLGEKIKKFGNTLRVQVFFHKQAPSTFHPKFSWFLNKDGMVLITGSGNLTERGLGKQKTPSGQSGNWEAFSIQSLNASEADSVKKEINDWLTAQKAAGTLCSLSDPSVIEKAMANGRVRYTYGEGTPPSPSPKAKKIAGAKKIVNTEEVGGELNTLEVLIRELPKNRSGQGDVGQTAHNKFFGHNGTDKDIFMQFVTLDDTLHPVKRVWLFYNDASDNYRLELPESKNSYELGAHDERMILIAIKLDSRSFRYTILRPITDKTHYEKVSLLLGPIKGVRRLMREKFATADDLLKAWKLAPSNLLPVRLPTPEP